MLFRSLRAFSEDTVKAAFAATGVHPFNPDAISDKQLKPSLPTSTKGSFPLPQPSPVRTIIAAMTACPPTSFDLSPTHIAPLAGPSHRSPSTSPSPSAQQQTPDPNIDPELQTPSKRIWLMYGALASTSSGSMLVSKTCMTSAYTVTTPVFEPLPELPQLGHTCKISCPIPISLMEFCSMKMPNSLKACIART